MFALWVGGSTNICSPRNTIPLVGVYSSRETQSIDVNLFVIQACVARIQQLARMAYVTLVGKQE